MALTIISKQPPLVLPANIKRTEEIDCDEYRGSLRSLIEFGLIRPDQLPAPGKSSVGYFQGEIIKRKCKRDETYLRIEINDDGGARVLVGVSHEVSALRRAAQYEARMAASAEAERRAAMSDPGHDAAEELLNQSSSRFEVGAVCMSGSGMLWEITRAYGVHRVSKDDGPYLHATGVRIKYCYGYLAKAPGRDVTFFQPHELWDADGKLKYLQVVR